MISMAVRKCRILPLNVRKAGCTLPAITCIWGNGRCRPAVAPELIAATFINTCMPFLRYAQGDYGRLLPESCECGIHTPLMEILGGSRYDFFEGPHGLVHGAVLERIFETIPGVRRYQIVQHSLGEYTVRVETDPGSDRKAVLKAAEAAVEKALTRIMERSVAIRFDNPLRLASGPGGKFRFIYRQPIAAA